MLHALQPGTTIAEMLVTKRSHKLFRQAVFLSLL